MPFLVLCFCFTSSLNLRICLTCFNRLPFDTDCVR